MAGDMARHPDDLGDLRRKLLTIASVLAMDTPVVVLDEPTTGLDAHGIERIGSIVRDLRAAGHTVIGISHDMRFVAEDLRACGPPRIAATWSWTARRLRSSPSSNGRPCARPAWSLLPPRPSGARLGLGSTPTEQSIIEALSRRHSSP